MSEIEQCRDFLERLSIHEDVPQLVHELPTITSSVRMDDIVPMFRDIHSLTKSDVESLIWTRARIHTSRLKGKQCFLVLRNKLATCQAVCSVQKDSKDKSKEQIQVLAKIPKESVVDVFASVQSTPFKVSGCSLQDIELHINKVLVVSRADAVLPLLIEDAMRPVNDQSLAHVNQDTRLDNRVLDLRTPANQAIYRIEAGITALFREQFEKYQFTEIFTPKIIGAASEGGANVFKVTYFKTDAYLAQSPQLYKQMAIAGDFERVFTIGAVFRAEDSNTHRHLTEFVGVDCEMAIKYHYHEALEIYGQMFVDLLSEVAKRHKHDLELIAQQYPFEPFIIETEKPLILRYEQGLRLLKEDGVEIEFGDDLSATLEKRLGRLIKQKYKTDFFILDKYPLSLRPFYTMPDPNDPRLSNSYDMFVRGEEVVSGAQRVHDPELLRKRIIAHEIDPEKLKDYIDSFRYGCSPHAGVGIGLERVVMLYLGLANVRYVSMFPRDPKRLHP